MLTHNTKVNVQCENQLHNAKGNDVFVVYLHQTLTKSCAHAVMYSNIRNWYCCRQFIVDFSFQI